MSAGQKVSGTRPKYFKEKVPVGKENAYPASRGKKSADGVDEEPRVSLGAKDGRKTGPRTHRTGIDFPTKKPPFHVHCDEKNAQGKVETKVKRVSTSDLKPTSTRETENERKKLEPQKVERGRSFISSKPVAKEKTLPPLKIHLRSCSASPGRLKSSLPRRLPRSSSVDLIAKSMRVPSSTRSSSENVSKLGCSRIPTTRRNISVDKTEGPGGKVTKRTTFFIDEVQPTKASMLRLKHTREILEKSKSCKKQLFSSPKSTVFGKPVEKKRTLVLKPDNGDDKSGKKLNSTCFSRASEPKRIRLGRLEAGVPSCSTGSGSTTTPIDVPPPAPVLRVKAMVRQTLAPENPSAHKLSGEVETDVFPEKLRFHMEYHDHLPMVEDEKENRSPKLSQNFLREHINAEQRRLVVSFLIHLGTHCHYQTYITYQAVKLFDAAMDRIRTETAYIQVTALAALWIALKKHANFHHIPTADTIVALSEGLYEGREDLLMRYERKILQALDFNVTFADVFSLLNHRLINCREFMDIADETMNILVSCGNYLIELTMLDEDFCRVPAAVVAVIAAELSLGLNLDIMKTPEAKPRWAFWRLILTIRYPVSARVVDEDFDKLRVALIRRVLHSGIKHSGFHVVYKKYKRSRFGAISQSLLEKVKRAPFAEVFDP